MELKIDLYCNDGSPIGVIPPDIYGRGVGGAELAMMSWCKEMAKRGHTVKVFNDPVASGFYDDVEYLEKRHYIPEDKRDVFVLFRSPNNMLQASKADVKLFWSTDQYTVGHYGSDIFPFVDNVVCISPYHVQYHKDHYGIKDERIGYFDLGVNLEDYDMPTEKIDGRCIFCSVPGRGLDILHMCWPAIKDQVPHASLVITADYRLWGIKEPRNHEHRLKWITSEDVTFLGKIPREELVKQQLAAVCQSYPCTYEELFCISSSECQVAGAYPVTTNFGALRSTNEFGTIIKGNPMDMNWRKEFTAQVVKALQSPMKKVDIKKARARFSWDRICGQWEDLIERGSFDESF